MYNTLMNDKRPTHWLLSASIDVIHQASSSLRVPAHSEISTSSSGSGALSRHRTNDKQQPTSMGAAS
jgi:hypothetical protein